MPYVLRTARLPSNSRLPAVNIQTVCTTLLSKGRTADFPNVLRDRASTSATQIGSSITVLADCPCAGVCAGLGLGSNRGHTGSDPARRAGRGRADGGGSREGPRGGRG